MLKSQQPKNEDFLWHDAGKYFCVSRTQLKYANTTVAIRDISSFTVETKFMFHFYRWPTWNYLSIFAVVFGVTPFYPIAWLAVLVLVFIGWVGAKDWYSRLVLELRSGKKLTLSWEARLFSKEFTDALAQALGSQ